MRSELLDNYCYYYCCYYYIILLLLLLLLLLILLSVFFFLSFSTLFYKLHFLNKKLYCFIVRCNGVSVILYLFLLLFLSFWRSPCWCQAGKFTLPKSRTSNRSKASNRSLFFMANTVLHDIRKVRMFFKHRNYKVGGWKRQNTEKWTQTAQTASKMLNVWGKLGCLITTLQVKLLAAVHFVLFFYHLYTLGLCCLSR